MSAAKLSLLRLIEWNGVEIAVDVDVGQVQAPAQVAAVRTLNLDDACAQIAESQGRIRAGEELAHIQHNDAFEQLAGGLGSRGIRHGFSIWSAKALASRYFTVCRCSQYRTSSPSPLNTS